MPEDAPLGERLDMAAVVADMLRLAAANPESERHIPPAMRDEALAVAVADLIRAVRDLRVRVDLLEGSRINP